MFLIIHKMYSLVLLLPEDIAMTDNISNPMNISTVETEEDLPYILIDVYYTVSYVKYIILHLILLHYYCIF